MSRYDGPPGLRLDVENRIDAERVVHSRPGLELLEDVAHGHVGPLPLLPGDESTKRTTLPEPGNGESAYVAVVRDHDPAELRCSLEVDRIVCALREGVDGAEHIPTTARESLDQRP